MWLDPVFLSRIQFAFTISFHIIFPAFTIGLAGYLAAIEWKFLKTKDETYKEIYKFWVKIFAVAFGMGVVSGVVMPYEFGTNWANFSARLGNVVGPLMAYEVLTAFFLEASFLGIMIFGWNKVSPKIHFASTIIVAIGTLISAFWILTVNSWMQTPAGFTIDENGIFHPLNWLKIIFNPSFIYRFSHMVVACYITTAFVVAGISALYLLKKKSAKHSKIMFSMALKFIIVATPLQIVIGDLHGLNTFKHQPAKIAAMEGIWETEKGAGLKLFGIPDQNLEKTKYSIEIPKLVSVILTHSLNGEVIGLKEWPKELRPPVLPVFFSFRVMVGLGFLMLALAIAAAVLMFQKKVFSEKWFQIWCVIMAPAGFIALLAGWFVAEIGRQPFVVYGFMFTHEAASAVSSEQVLFSLIAFILVYIAIFSAAIFYISRLIKKGISTQRSPKAAPAEKAVTSESETPNLFDFS
jgi:cytochrome d ubiquinol oxidase subunit I